MYIYGLFTDQLCWYVGRTIDLKRREWQHKRGTIPNNGGSLIPSLYDWDMRVLEETEDKNRERLWIETLTPLLNHKVPCRTTSESMRATDKKRRELRRVWERERYNSNEAYRQRKRARNNARHAAKKAAALAACAQPSTAETVSSS